MNDKPERDRPDRVLTLDEVCAMTRETKATLRYKRHKGEAPYLFKIGRRLVAYERDVAAHIAARREATRRG
ncbi:helix-turn-helix transcriptional regulator [Jiangella rhizosphaerae]|nr:hypothetical protein [Jiangella rhizosphaerae]